MNFSVKYIVNEESKVVVCTILGCKYNAIRFVNKHMNFIDSPSDLLEMPEKFFMNPRYKGVAKCSDEEIGKKIAYQKAYSKYCKSLKAKALAIKNDFMKFYLPWINNFDKTINLATKKSLRAEETLSKTLEEVYETA